MSHPFFKIFTAAIERSTTLILVLLWFYVFPPYVYPDNAIEVDAHGKISITARDIAIVELLDELQRKTGILLYLVEGLEGETFSGKVNHLNVGDALSYLLKEKSYAVVYNDSNMNNPIEVLHTDLDQRYRSNIGNIHKKRDASSRIRGLTSKPDPQIEKSDRLPANNATTNPRGNESDGRLTSSAESSSWQSHSTSVKWSGHLIEQMGDDEKYGKATSGGGVLSEAENDRLDPYHQREEWLLNRIESTERRLESGYSDRIYENQVRDSGSEDGIMHDSEWLVYYEEKLADLRAGQW